MRTYLRTDSENVDFQMLVALLDIELRILDGDDHVFYAQFNKSDMIKHVVVAYEHNVAVGCGALRGYADDTVEIKRMYVPVAHRNKGIATGILHELEIWAISLNFEICILETGNRQLEALHLYPKAGYNLISNFGKYEGIENSICFEKILKD